MGRLSAVEIGEIDAALLGHVRSVWRKAARVIGTAMADLPSPDLPAVFYARRLRSLVEEGRPGAFGDLHYVHFSEIRVPRSHGEA